MGVESQMDKQWFYAIGDKTEGPISENDLMQMLSRGEISKDTLIWAEGMDNWVSISNLGDRLSKPNHDSQHDLNRTISDIQEEKSISNIESYQKNSVVQPSVKKSNLRKWIIAVIILLCIVMVLFFVYRCSQTQANFYKANSLLDLGQYQKAIDEYTKAIELKPDDADIYNNRGYAYDRLGQYQRAIEDYNEAIRLNPGLVLTYNNRGNAYHKLWLYNAAREDYDKAISLKPNDPLAYYNYACMFSLQNDATEACKWLQLAIKKGYNDWKFIQEDKDFDNIRNSACYSTLLGDRRIEAKSNITEQSPSSTLNNYEGFSDIYKKDAEFKKSFLEALRSVGISKPSWVPNGVQTPMKPVAIGDKTYLSAFVCKPHDCQDNQIAFLYLKSQNRVVGIYKDLNHPEIWFGNPSESEQASLKQ